MIGVYDYTVILTYLSVASSVAGITFAMGGNPLYAVLCLMLAGLFDMYDGKVARTKKERDKISASFGVQIDSLADIIGFGILPVVIGYSIGMTTWYYAIVAVIFVLAALIRLAYFNVLEETKGRQKTFIGLPTTSVALLLPIVFVFKNLTTDCTFPIIYAGTLLVIAFLFLLPKKFIRKPDTKKMITYIIIGVVEFAIIYAVFRLWTSLR